MRQLRERIQKFLIDAQPVSRKLVWSVAVFVLAIASLLVALNSPKPYKIVASTPEATAQVSSLVGAIAFVHVVGEVKNPGIYPVDSDARLFDAVFAAGGFTALADQSSVNLAREVSDGEQIFVLAKGAEAATPSSDAGLISLNRASQSELEQLPGVGPVLAARLIDWRTSNGGFKKIEDLQRVSGIGQKLFDAIRPRATL